MSLPSITEWEMYITAQGCRLRNDLYCVEWDVKLYYTIPYRMQLLLQLLHAVVCNDSRPVAGCSVCVAALSVHLALFLCSSRQHVVFMLSVFSGAGTVAFGVLHLLSVEAFPTMHR